MNNFFSAVKKHKFAALLVSITLVIVGLVGNSTDDNNIKQLTTDSIQVISNNVINNQKQTSNKNNNSNKSTSTKKGSKIATNSKSKKSTKNSVASNYTVYITRTGSKYHRSGCRYLRRSMIKTTKNDAVSIGYSACSICKP